MSGGKVLVRKIIHCDCDCFYASVEVLDQPALAGLPLAVGGRPEDRGVVASCNYEARAFGVRSAMPVSRALTLCPALQLLAPRMSRYAELSRQIMAIYRQYSEHVEPLSLDEAYIDVTGSQHLGGSATLIASEIRARVRQEVGLVVSAGVAPNKFLAKIASDWNKPDGLCVIAPEKVAAFVEALPVGKIHGVGPVTRQKLERHGWLTCGDLQQASLEELSALFGRFAEALYERARGMDSRLVVAERESRSLSVETTFRQDLTGRDRCLAELPALFAQLQRRVVKSGQAARIHKCVVKIRFSDFSQTTHETLSCGMSLELFEILMTAGLTRKPLPVRLLGLGVRLAPSDTQGVGDARQLSLF